MPFNRKAMYRCRADYLLRWVCLGSLVQLGAWCRNANFTGFRSTARVPDSQLMQASREEMLLTGEGVRVMTGLTAVKQEDMYANTAIALAGVAFFCIHVLCLLDPHRFWQTLWHGRTGDHSETGRRLCPKKETPSGHQGQGVHRPWFGHQSWQESLGVGCPDFRLHHVCLGCCHASLWGCGCLLSNHEWSNCHGQLKACSHFSSLQFRVYWSHSHGKFVSDRIFGWNGPRVPRQQSLHVNAWLQYAAMYIVATCARNVMVKYVPLRGMVAVQRLRSIKMFPYPRCSSSSLHLSIKFLANHPRCIKMNQDESRWIKMNQDEST